MVVSKFEKLKNFVKIFLSRYSGGNVSDSAVVLAFYSLLSIFPLLFIAGSMLNLLNVNAADFEMLLRPILPDRIYQTLEPVIDSTIHGGGGGQLSIGIIVTIWSASRAIAAFQRTINQTYGVAENQTAVTNRILSFVWTLLLIAVVGIIILFAIFGQMILGWLQPIIHVPNWILDLIGTVKWPSTLIVVWIVLTALFYFVPTAKVKLRYVVFGALLATIGLMVLGQVFTIYLKYFAKGVTAYKAIGTFIVLMFWLDFSALILLVGGVFNASLQEFKQGPIEEDRDAFAEVVSRAKKLRRSASRKVSKKKRPPRKKKRKRRK
ncbi:YihY/virulence factor BrkB family protein [Lentilactobacillus sp. Marseille-Q4993]|uniref:YihY/virulence factor BrkB family protein n=1 Tax=Lentilactobacillus sp. Marseille-Q4993 TaxID=3039492 RepID=UPI0024BCDF80|nr:YihY/virulence factor BrkB family protein [Lentilactobacillus sp. Marseille-Q4993]